MAEPCAGREGRRTGGAGGAGERRSAARAEAPGGRRTTVGTARRARAVGDGGGRSRWSGRVRHRVKATSRQRPLAAEARAVTRASRARSGLVTAARLRDLLDRLLRLTVLARDAH